MPRPLRAATRAFIALVLIVAVGCSSRGNPTPTATAGPLPPALQQILQQVSSIRGLSPPPTVKAQVVSRSQLPDLLMRLLTDDDRRWFAQTTTLYRLLGHLRKDQDYESVYLNFGAADVAGLYSPVDHELWVVRGDGSNLDFNNLSPQDRQTFAHELVHAIQDYHFNLDAIDKSVVNDLDLNLTSTCVIEGDAVTYAGLYASQYLAVPVGRSAVLLRAPAASSDTPASLTREFYFPYEDGAAWIDGVRQKHGSTAIDAMLTQPPKGTAYVLHPERLDAGWQPTVVKLPDLTSALGGGWKRDSGGTFGEFELRNYLQLHVPGGTAATVAAGWQGDHYDVYVNGDESVAAFDLRFSDANAAAAFRSAQQTFMKSAEAKVTAEGGITYAATPDGNVTATADGQGNDVLFAIGSSKTAAQRALEALVHG